MSFSHICIRNRIDFVEDKYKVFSLFSKKHRLLFHFTLPCNLSARPPKKDRGNTSTLCLMRTGQRESKFVFKIPYVISLLTRDLSKVTCAEKARSSRHKRLRFNFWDLPVGDKMILQRRITMVRNWKERQRPTAVFALKTVPSFQAFQLLV